MTKRQKRLFKFILILIILAVIMVALYICYFYKEYKRIPDQIHLDQNITSSYSYFQNEEAVNAGRAYNILTYDIGYGARMKNFSSYLDGGNDIKASSEENVLANICGITDVINRSGADFILLQEVDIDSTRSYGVDELSLINKFLYGYYYAEAKMAESMFIPYPILNPQGVKNTSMVTYSNAAMSENVRRSLPMSDDVFNMTDYDKCYTLSRIPLANERELVIYNVHLSTYVNSEDIYLAQIDTIFKDMQKEYLRGNYVICGGDFGRNLKNDSSTSNIEWAKDFPQWKLPAGFSIGTQASQANNVDHNTRRSAHTPYDPATSFTASTDGFIVSDNIRVNFYSNANWKYEYSDHDPVIMQFFLKEATAQDAYN